MKLLITLTLALADANGRLTRYARNSSYSTSHPGRCDRNVFERQFYDLAKGLEPRAPRARLPGAALKSNSTSTKNRAITNKRHHHASSATARATAAK